jgi:hypothetical protein
MTRAVELAQVAAAGVSEAFKNRIINGAMVIDQRATSISATGYSVDRWRIYNAASSKMTAAQSSTAPTGFSKSLLLTSTSAYTIPANYDGWMAQQYIEGFNTADLGWGTANAKTVTLSFWVYSSLTGTFGGSIANSAGNRSYPFSYTISSANTWEYETITIAGDTSGTWIGATNGIGLKVNLSVGMGSDYATTAGAWATGEYYSVPSAVSIIGTNGATWYITGVQLEVGSSATGFEYVNYQTSLANCQRYFQMYKNGTANGPSINGFTQAINSTDSYGAWAYIQTMRASPTLAYGGTIRVVDQSSGFTITTLSFLANETSNYIASIRAQTASGMTTYRIYNINNSSDATAYISLSAEL